MVAIAPSVAGDNDQAHVFCQPCWWGEDVPADKAAQIATEHEATREHLAAEEEERDFELLLEAVRDHRGY
jgi:hypothetical protein